MLWQQARRQCQNVGKLRSFVMRTSIGQLPFIWQSTSKNAFKYRDYINKLMSSMNEKTNYDNLQGQLPQELNLNIILTKKYLMV